MQVAQYTFQSPSTSQVQVGKLDPNSLKEDTSASSSEKNETQVQEVKTQASTSEIDFYA